MECVYKNIQEKNAEPSVITSMTVDNNEIKVVTADRKLHKAENTEEMLASIEEILKLQLEDYCEDEKGARTATIISTSAFAAMSTFLGIKTSIGEGTDLDRFLLISSMILATLGVTISLTANDKTNLKLYSYYLKKYEYLKQKGINTQELSKYTLQQLKNMANNKKQDKTLALVK